MLGKYFTRLNLFFYQFFLPFLFLVTSIFQTAGWLNARCQVTVRQTALPASQCQVTAYNGALICLARLSPGKWQCVLLLVVLFIFLFYFFLGGGQIIFLDGFLLVFVSMGKGIITVWQCDSVTLWQCDSKTYCQVPVTMRKKRPLFFKFDCLPRQASKWKMHFLVLVLKFAH